VGPRGDAAFVPAGRLRPAAGTVKELSIAPEIFRDDKRRFTVKAYGFGAVSGLMPAAAAP